MVEAAGIEPASEAIQTRSSTCIALVLFSSPVAQSRPKWEWLQGLARGASVRGLIIVASLRPALGQVPSDYPVLLHLSGTHRHSPSDGGGSQCPLIHFTARQRGEPRSCCYWQLLCLNLCLRKIGSSPGTQSGSTTTPSKPVRPQ